MKTETIRNIGELIAAVKRAGDAFKEGGNTTRVWYRGITKATSHKLIPSIYRAPFDRNPKFNRTIEIQLAAEFLRYAPCRHHNCPPKDQAEEWLSLMQHYGLPTRLMDWTESPLIAAYFAVGHVEAADDAAVWALSVSQLNTYFGVASLPVLDNPELRPLLQAAFKADAVSPAEIVAAMPNQIDSRMSMQYGCFTIHGMPTPLEETNAAPKCLIKFLIPRTDREEFRKELGACGVRRLSLFADLHNLSIDIRDTWERWALLDKEF